MPEQVQRKVSKIMARCNGGSWFIPDSATLHPGYEFLRVPFFRYDCALAAKREKDIDIYRV
jgi:hypothetical protein